MASFVHVLCLVDGKIKATMDMSTSSTLACDWSLLNLEFYYSDPKTDMIWMLQMDCMLASRDWCQAKICNNFYF